MQRKKLLPIKKRRKRKLKRNQSAWKSKYYRLIRTHESLIRDLYHKFSGTVKRKRGIVQISHANIEYLALLEKQFLEEDRVLAEIAAKYNNVKIKLRNT